MDVSVRLVRIIISETADQQIIVLKEEDGPRGFPIVIGITEALAIDRRIKGQRAPRPLTHDLMADVINQMGGSLEKVTITDLREGTFYAKLSIQLNGKQVEVDSRPSDAIALGCNMDVPFFVAEHVLDEASH